MVCPYMDYYIALKKSTILIIDYGQTWRHYARWNKLDIGGKIWLHLHKKLE